MASDLDAVLQSLDLKMTATHQGLITNEEWQCDVWTCTISYQGRKFSTPFKTGLGHRKMLPMVERSGVGYYNKVKRAYARDLADACEQGWFAPVKPSVADVLYCLASDAHSAESTFEEWCSDLGYDTDSRKAFDTYQACMATRDKLIRLVGRELFEEIANSEH